MKSDWMRAEAYLLMKRFGRVEFDVEHFWWFWVHRFPLPPGFNKEESGLLVELDVTYPFTPPVNVYLDRNIRFSSGEAIDHYFPGSYQNKLFSKGWAWLSLHVEGWKPDANIVRGDNLLKYCDLVYLTLEGLAKKKG